MTDQREGTRRVYQVDAARLAVLRADLDELWQRSLAAAGLDPRPGRPVA